MTSFGMKQWTVYCHTHAESGRRYIGITCQTMQQRWNQHVSKSVLSKDGRWHFPNAIRKYGKDAFTHEVLAVCNSLKSANATERRLIKKYDTRNPERGFNLASGGAHTPHSIQNNPWDRPEYRKKLSAAMKAKWLDPGFRVKAMQAITTNAKKKILEKQYSSKNGVFSTLEDLNQFIDNIKPNRFVSVCRVHGNLRKSDVYVGKRKYRDTYRIEFSCKECSNRSMRESYVENLSVRRKRNEEYRKTHRETCRAGIKAWRERNRTELLAKKKVYHEKNRDVINEKRRERRRLSSLSGDVTFPNVQDL